MTRDDRDIPDLSDLAHEWPECIAGKKVDLLRLPAEQSDEVIDRIAREYDETTN